MDEHLADCATCYETFAETAPFALGRGGREPVPESGAASSPFVIAAPPSSMAAGLAVAAGLVLAVPALLALRVPRARRPRSSPSWPRPWARRRFIEPRLTGGFQHGRLVVLRSGGTTATGPRRAIAGRPRRRRPHPRASRGRHLARGPGRPRRHVPRLGRHRRGRQGPRVGDGPGPEEPPPPERPLRGLPRARDPPRRARRTSRRPSKPPRSRSSSKDAPDEAWFNRALALEQLHLVDSAEEGLGRLPEARLDLGLGRRSPQAPRRAPPGPAVHARRRPRPRPRRARGRPGRHRPPG